MFLKFYFPKNFVYLTMLIVKQYLFLYKEVPLLQVLSHTACLRAFACIPRLFPDGTWVLTASLGRQTEQSFSCIYFDITGCDISVAEYHTYPLCLFHKYMNTTDEHTHPQTTLTYSNVFYITPLALYTPSPSSLSSLQFQVFRLSVGPSKDLCAFFRYFSTPFASKDSWNDIC